VLSQIRAMQTQRPAAGAGAVSGADNGTGAANFSDAMKSALNSVNASQQSAADLAKRFELGDDRVDLAQTMIAGAKAQVQFRAAVEVRNRMVSAYQDIMNMPI